MERESMFTKHNTPAPGCVDGAWCAFSCEECWRQFDEGVKRGDLDFLRVMPEGYKVEEVSHGTE